MAVRENQWGIVHTVTYPLGDSLGNNVSYYCAFVIFSSLTDHHTHTPLPITNP